MQSVTMQLPRVIEIEMPRQTDAEIIADLLKKLPPKVASLGGGCPVQVPYAPVHAACPKPGFRPPPGLSFPGAPPGLDCPTPPEEAMAWSCAWGYAKATDSELASTRDDTDSETCEAGRSREVEEQKSGRVALGQGGPSLAPGEMTTLMIRNIPVMYTQELLMREWKDAGAYDFLYVPHTGKLNLSYGFINFLTEADAMAFRGEWHHRRLAQYTARKPLSISFADVQGLEANVEQLMAKNGRRGEARQCRPVIIKSGQHLSLTQYCAWVASGAA